MLAADIEPLEGHICLITGNLVPNGAMNLAMTKHRGSSCSQSGNLKVPEELRWSQMNSGGFQQGDRTA